MQITSFNLESVQEALVQLVLGEHAVDQYKKGKISDGILRPHAERIRDMSEQYVKNRDLKVIAPFGKEAATTYSLYFLPINYFKISILLEKLSISAADGFSILDYGCGPGTASLAALNKLKSKASVILCDHSPAMIEIAKKLITKLYSNVSLKEESLVNTIGGQYDLILASNVLNELTGSTQFEQVQRLSEMLKPQGHLLILEPALQKTTRDLMILRDKLILGSEDLKPIYPCTRRDACPMLKASEVDWCHAEIGWQLPQLVSQLDELTGFNKHRLKYSAMIFQKSTNKPDPDKIRIVGVPRKNKIGFSVLGCGVDFYNTISLGKRDRSEKNLQIEKANMHDLINISGFNKQQAKLKAENEVEFVEG